MRGSKQSLVEGPIYKNLMIFTIPILLGSIVTQLYHVADSAIVGRFVDAEALAAVAAATPVMSLINLFQIGLSSGSNVVIAHHSGAQDRTALQRSMDTVAALTLACSAFITVLGMIVCRPLLILLGTPEAILGDAHAYLMIIFLGTTGNLVYQMGSGALRGMGDSKWPFYFLVFCSILNVLLDLVAVLVFNMGVFGVAIATSVSQLVSGLGVIWRTNHGGYGVKVGVKYLHFYKEEVKKILNIGLPAAIQNIGNSMAAMFVQSSVNVFGSDFIAGNSIVTKVDEICYIPFMSIGTALSTYVGQNMGVMQLDRVKKGINYSIWTCCGFGVIMCGGLLLLRDVCPYIFTTDATVAAYASRGLLIMSFSCLYVGIDRCLVNAMRGAGKSVVPMVTAQFGAFSRIPLAYYLGARPMNSTGIFYALLIATALRCIAISFYYYGGGWKRALEKFEKTWKEKEKSI